MQVRIHRSDDLDIIYDIVKLVRFPHPLADAYFLLRIRNFSFPAAGHYQISLLAENELLAQRKVRILLKETSS